MDEQIGFFRRFGLAFIAFFAVLFNREFALAVFRLRVAQKAALPLPKPELPAAGTGARPDGEAAYHREALHVLSILQRDGRFIDFLQEDLAPFSDAEVGAAARTVHSGCRQALASYFELEPILREPEGASVTVQNGFDPAAVRLTGNVVGSPPFRGSLKHHGWKAKAVKLPTSPAGQDPAIVAPAEVELQ